MFEDFDSNDLLVLANDVQSAFNRTREQLHNKVHHYYHQSIASTYVKETDILELIETCQSYKNQYLQIRDVLVGRGIKLRMEPWTVTNDTYFVTA